MSDQEATDWGEVMYDAQLAKTQAEVDLFTAQRRAVDLSARKALAELDKDGTCNEDDGVFVLYGGVDSDTISSFIQRLDSWSRRHPENTLTLVLTSPGGGVYDGLALHGFLKELKRRGHTIVTKCLGAALSMGAILLQAGDERVMDSDAFFLIHEVQMFSMGYSGLSQTADQHEVSKKIQGVLSAILAEKSNLSAEEINEKVKKTDWLMTAAEALEHKFVDRIEGS